MIIKRRAGGPVSSAVWRRLLDVVLVIAALGTGAARMQPWVPRPELSFVAAVVLALSALSLPWRRRAPAPIYALAIGANTLQLFAEESTTISVDVGAVVAGYALAVNGRAPWRVLLPVAAVVPMAWGTVRVLDNAAGDYTLAAGTAVAAATIAVPWLLGANVEARQRALDGLKERAARLEAERELEAVRAVVEERGRIARELHDIVAHHVSVMGVQAGAARLALTSDPQQAETSLRRIESTARQAVDEMRRMLGILRGRGTSAGSPGEQASGEAAPLSPQPGLADLPRLAGSFAAAGLAIEMTVDWRLDQSVVTPSEAVQLSAYRIVEQGLTNVLEHAGPAPTTVHVVVGDDAVEVTVSNAAGPRGGAGPDRPVARPGRGHGTVGMRERVKMFDGILNAGALPDGGYRVYARLPLAATR